MFFNVLLIFLENDVKAKIDDELTNFRDRLHLILNQRQINCEYLFGIAQEDHGCENMPQVGGLLFFKKRKLIYAQK